MRNIVNKLTMANMGLLSEVVKKVATEKAESICRFYGWVNAYEVVTTQNGPSLQFFGQVAGINLLTGEETFSSCAFFPQVAEGLIAALISSTNDAEETEVTRPGRSGDERRKRLSTKGEIRFGFDIAVTKNSSPIGYQYSCKTLIDTSKSDPLAELRNSLPSHPNMKTLKLEKKDIKEKKVG